MGASVLAARYWGMRELNSLRKTVAIMIRIVVGISILFALVTYGAPEYIMKIYTDNLGRNYIFEINGANIFLLWSVVDEHSYFKVCAESEIIGSCFLCGIFLKYIWKLCADVWKMRISGNGNCGSSIVHFDSTAHGICCDFRLYDFFRKGNTV